jgi:hypothetical protein
MRRAWPRYTKTWHRPVFFESTIKLVTLKDSFERRLFNSINLARVHPRAVAECFQTRLQQPNDQQESNASADLPTPELIEQLQTAPSLPPFKYSQSLALVCGDCLASYKSVKDRLDAPYRPPVLDSFMEARGVVVLCKGVLASYCKGTPEEFVLNLMLNKDNRNKLYDFRCDIAGLSSREDQCLGSLVLFCSAQSKAAEGQSPSSSLGCPAEAHTP